MLVEMKKTNELTFVKKKRVVFVFTCYKAKLTRYFEKLSRYHSKLIRYNAKLMHHFTK